MSDPVDEPRFFEDRLVKMLDRYSAHAARRPSAEMVSQAVAEGVAVLRRPRWQSRIEGRPRLFMFAALLLALALGGAIVGGGLLDRRTAVVPPVPPSRDPGFIASPGPDATPLPTRPPDRNATPAPPSTAQPAVFTPSCMGLFKNSGPERLPAPSNHLGTPTAGSLLALLWPPLAGESLARNLALVDAQSGAATPEQFFSQLAYLRVLPTDGQNLFDWSPDGHYFTLHYSDATYGYGQYAPCDDAFLVSADGTGTWHMLGVDSDEEFVAWGADGATWITSSRVGGSASVYVRSLASGDRIDLGAPCDGCRLEAPGGSWAADRASFAATALDSNGQSRPVVHDGQGWVEGDPIGRALGWIEDGSVLLAAVEPGGQARLVSWTPRSSGLTDVAPLSVDPATSLLSLSPDGKLLAIGDANSGVGIVDLGNDGRITIVDPRKGDRQAALQLAWSPDSKQLAFVAKQTPFVSAALWAVNADGANLHLIHDGVTAGLSWQPVWP